MSHFAHINEDGFVDEVIVIEQESIDTGLWGDPSRWIQTSYNTRGGIHYQPDSEIPSEDQSKALRKNYAGVGYFYDSTKDAFIPQKPFQSWVLDDFSCTWKPPIEYPNDGKYYSWVEETLSWNEIEL